MKIAISSDNGFVSEHFGRCEEYAIFDIENNKITKQEILKNPGHEPSFLPKFLKKKGVNVIITQGAGPRAIELLNNFGIKVILTEKEENKEVIKNYLKGELKEKENQCNH